MVSTTFLNLKDQKRTKIDQALLAEFSAYPLAESQVARIIETADISRGAFYKYFDDLTDAYLYEYHNVMKSIHEKIIPSVEKSDEFDPEFYFSSTKNYLDTIAQSPYRELIMRHITQNSATLLDEERHALTQFEKLNALDWAATTLSHDVLRQILLVPDQKDHLLQNYHDTLVALKERK